MNRINYALEKKRIYMMGFIKKKRSKGKKFLFNYLSKEIIGQCVGEMLDEEVNDFCKKIQNINDELLSKKIEEKIIGIVSCEIADKTDKKAFDINITIQLEKNK